MAGGLVTSLIYYAIARGNSVVGSADELDLLKQELIKELKDYALTNSINPPKDPKDFTFTREFMIYIFRILYTFQTVAKQVITR